jgi:hypothetical protein
MKVCTKKRELRLRRGGRVVEGARLESVFYCIFKVVNIPLISRLILS